MTRMLCPLPILVLLALVSSSGCASWHYRHETNQDQASSSGSNGNSWLLQGLSNASLHNWDFRRGEMSP